ncbi:MAG: S8 family serine peptidase [Gemmatimonadales bacterium]
MPIIPPAEAYSRGWMPLRPTGVPAFLAAHPTYDGRGVIIGILDSGQDPGIPGLGRTTTGDRKFLDLRDFSGEGAVTLTATTATGDQLTLGGRVLSGISRLRGLQVGHAMWVGTVAELPLGELPGSDLNGDHDNSDTLGVVVLRATDGWVLVADTDGDGSLADEVPVHDFLVARETFAWHSGTRPAPLTIAVNLSTDSGGAPRLSLFFDTSSHGSHVAGIAAGHDLYGIKGFSGVAPGAWLLGLKIANNAQGGISTSGSMLAAMDYAIHFAAERRAPLVLNMSFGVGNEAEGQAVIDGLVDSVLNAHPELVFTISAGNDGPGLSTMGFPGSSNRALTIGATYPAVFLGASGKGADPIAYFSSRGGETAKPDIVTPGLAFSTVPRWNTGNEQKGGTSMASPHAAGLVALLVSGLTQEKRPINSRQIRQALMVTAHPLAGETFLDDGTGLPDVGAAWRWLGTPHQIPDIAVRARDHGLTAAWRIRPLGTTDDTLQGFDLVQAAGSAATDLTFRSNANWLRAPGGVRVGAGTTTVTLGLQAGALNAPGAYVGVVSGWTGDTLAGPIVRLITTVVVPDTGASFSADLGEVPAGGAARRFFMAQAGRPFAVAYSTRDASEQVVAWLHEPGGQPYQEENGIGAGAGEQAGLYIVDGRHVRDGMYEALVTAPPLEPASAAIIVQQSPLRISAARVQDSIALRLENLSPAAVSTEPFVVLVGAERAARVVANGSGRQNIRFALPAWAVHAAIDVSMDPTQWPRFTDFGVTLFDGAGRQLGKSPLNYATGRLQVDLPSDGVGPAELALFPGFADVDADERWTADISIRLYADSAHVTGIPGSPLSIAPGSSGTLSLPLGTPALTLGDGFFPLGIVVVPEADRTWTREVPLPPSLTPRSP